MAQRTSNNPPFGYKFFGDAADDITELFSLISSDSTTASNGLTKTGDNIELGGTLTGDTTINTSTNKITIDDGTNTFFNVNISPKGGERTIGIGLDAQFGESELALGSKTLATSTYIGAEDEVWIWNKETAESYINMNGSGQVFIKGESDVNLQSTINGYGLSVNGNTLDFNAPTIDYTQSTLNNISDFSWNLSNGTSNYYHSTSVDGKTGDRKMGFGFNADTDFGSLDTVTPTIEEFGVVTERIQLYQDNGVNKSNVRLTDGSIEIVGDTGVGINGSGSITLSSLPTYADNASAITGGLSTDDVYKTATGELRIVV